MVWCRKIESVTIFRIVKSIDPKAFITQSNVSGVYGNGFDKMRVKMKKSKSQTLRPRSPNITAERCQQPFPSPCVMPASLRKPPVPPRQQLLKTRGQT